MFEGRGSCWIYVRCQNKAGNWYIPAENELSIRAYNIDFTNPIISESNLKKKDSLTYTFQITAEDNFKLQGCLLYVDGENQGVMDSITPNCINICSFEKDLSVTDYGVHNVYAYCRDIAGNWGRGETHGAVVNTPPVIGFCRASPVSGNLKTEIEFFVQAEDIDETAEPSAEKSEIKESEKVSDEVVAKKEDMAADSDDKEEKK